MTTAFVLSGGGSLGAVQVGMLQALADHGISPDLLVGTSAGALNAAYVAGRGFGRRTTDDLADLWRQMEHGRIFPPEPRRALLALVGRRSSLFAVDRLAELIDRHLGFGFLEDAVIPLRVVACDLLSGTETTLARGPAAAAILASCAIPGVFPPVEIEGRLLVDGALANNTAISVAVEAGADEVYVLPSGYPCALTEAPRSALGVLSQATSILIHQRVVHDTAEYAGSTTLVVVPPPCPLTVATTDFRHARELIATGYQVARDWLTGNGGRREDPAAHIGIHTHPSGLTPPIRGDVGRRAPWPSTG